MKDLSKSFSQLTPGERTTVNYFDPGSKAGSPTSPRHSKDQAAVAASRSAFANESPTVARNSKERSVTYSLVQLSKKEDASKRIPRSASGNARLQEDPVPMLAIAAATASASVFSSQDSSKSVSLSITPRVLASEDNLNQPFNLYYSFLREHTVKEDKTQRSTLKRLSTTLAPVLVFNGEKFECKWVPPSSEAKIGTSKFLERLITDIQKSIKADFTEFAYVESHSDEKETRDDACDKNKEEAENIPIYFLLRDALDNVHVQYLLNNNEVLRSKVITTVLDCLFYKRLNDAKERYGFLENIKKYRDSIIEKLAAQQEKTIRCLESKLKEEQQTAESVEKRTFVKLDYSIKTNIINELDIRSIIEPMQPDLGIAFAANLFFVEPTKIYGITDKGHTELGKFFLEAEMTLKAWISIIEKIKKTDDPNQVTHPLIKYLNEVLPYKKWEQENRSASVIKELSPTMDTDTKNEALEFIANHKYFDAARLIYAPLEKMLADRFIWPGIFPLTKQLALKAVKLLEKKNHPIENTEFLRESITNLSVKFPRKDVDPWKELPRLLNSIEICLRLPDEIYSQVHVFKKLLIHMQTNKKIVGKGHSTQFQHSEVYRELFGDKTDLDIILDALGSVGDKPDTPFRILTINSNETSRTKFLFDLFNAKSDSEIVTAILGLIGPKPDSQSRIFKTAIIYLLAKNPELKISMPNKDKDILLNGEPTRGDFTEILTNIGRIISFKERAENFSSVFRDLFKYLRLKKVSWGGIDVPKEEKAKATPLCALQFAKNPADLNASLTKLLGPIDEPSLLFANTAKFLIEHSKDMLIKRGVTGEEYSAFMEKLSNTNSKEDVFEILEKLKVYFDKTPEIDCSESYSLVSTEVDVYTYITEKKK